MNVEESMLLSASPTLGPRLKPELCSWIRCPGITATILVTISCLAPLVSLLELQSSDDNPTDQYVHPIITSSIHYKLWSLIWCLGEVLVWEKDFEETALRMWNETRWIIIFRWLNHRRVLSFLES